MNEQFMSDLEDAFKEKYGAGMRSFCACKKCDFAVIFCEPFLALSVVNVKKIIVMTAQRNAYQIDERLVAAKEPFIYFQNLWVNFTIIREEGTAQEIRISLSIPEELKKKIA